MRYSKGQAMIGIVVTTAFTVALLFTMKLLTAPAAGQTDVQVSRSVDVQVNEIRKRSILTSTMNDYLWRAGVRRGKYGDMPAYRLVSYFFSSDGPLYIHGKKISREEARKDLEGYLAYKMNQYWRRGPVTTDYRIEISAPGSDIEPVSVGTYSPTGRYSLVSFPVALSGGRNAKVKLWTKTSSNVQSVELGSP